LPKPKRVWISAESSFFWHGEGSLHVSKIWKLIPEAHKFPPNYFVILLDLSYVS
jgi:hypothetical protein